MYLFNFGEDPVVSSRESNSEIIKYLTQLSAEDKKVILKIIKAFRMP